MSDWSREWNYCRKCNKTENKHAGEGYCKVCYDLIINQDPPNGKWRNCAGITPSGVHCGKPFYSKDFGHRRCSDCLRRERENNEIDKQHKTGLKISAN